ncbi:AMP-binding protein, partial [Dietzia cercidiphylli]|uniref:AMP-binding protein n=1 Tax=Dietzia cercidiphylli TaxID=498199 RepID=UPI003F7E3210
SERRWLVDEVNDTDVAVDSAATLAEILESAADRSPESEAVVDGKISLTYRELDMRAEALADRLAARGARPERSVAIALPRSIDFVVALWAVAKTGAAFVPVDPALPLERVQYMLGAASVQLGVTRGNLQPRLPSDVDWLAIDVSSEVMVEGRSLRPSRAVLANAAYVIFTSGSTGRPKGVVVTHAGLSNLLAEANRQYQPKHNSRVLLNTTVSFDPFIEEVFVAVSERCVLVVRGDEAHEEPPYRFINSMKVSHAFMTPTLLATIDPSDVPNLTTIVVGGELCSESLVRKWEPGRVFVNSYGPTEATVSATFHRAGVGAVGGPVPLGSPAQGFRMFVLDAGLRLVPVGVVGELYLCGAQLA